MIQSKKALIIALLLPILALLLLTAYKKYVLTFGKEIVLPISGYDPRDLLSGHFLTYRIEYAVAGVCSSEFVDQPAYICLDPKVFSYTTPNQCATLIAGVCKAGRFEAGIEKYFVPESKARSLETQIQAKSASIVLSVTADGQAQVKDLLLDGQSWKGH